MRKEMSKYDKHISAYLAWHKKMLAKFTKDFAEYEKSGDASDKYFEYKRVLLSQLQNTEYNVGQIITKKEKEKTDYYTFAQEVMHDHNLLRIFLNYFIGFLPNTQHKKKFIHNLMTYPDYEHFKHIYFTIIPKIMAAFRKKEKKDLQFKRIVERFFAGKKRITLVLEYTEKLYEEMTAQKEAPSLPVETYNTFFKHIAEMIKQILQSRPGMILSSSCTLTFNITADKPVQNPKTGNFSLPYNAAFLPNISTIKNKYFFINQYCLAQFAQARDYSRFPYILAHEIAHAFDTKIDPERQNMLRAIYEYYKGDITDSKALAIAGFLKAARAEGLAKIAETKETAADIDFLLYDLRNYKKAKEDLLELIEKIPSESISITAQQEVFKTLSYDLGRWMFFLIQAKRIAQSNTKLEYFVITQNDFFKLREQFKQRKIHPKKLYRTGIKSILKELKIKSYKMQEVKKYIGLDKNLSVLKLMRTKERQFFMLVPKLGMFELYEKYLEACKYFKLPRKHILFESDDFERIMKLKERMRRIQAQREGFMTEALKKI